MTDLLYYFIIGLMVIIFILSIMIYKKLNVFKLIILLLMLFLIVVWEFFPSLITDLVSFSYLEDVYYGILLIVVIFFSITFRHKIKVTENLTDQDFFELEKKLEQVNDSSELLRKRFIHSIELMNEGLIFYESDFSSLYITDQIKTLINLQKNALSMESYTNLIHEEDKKMYEQTIKKVNAKLSTFEIKYRIQTDESYAWIIEKGKVFKHDREEHIISTVKPVNLKLFPDTLIEELDSVPYEDDLTKTLSTLRKGKDTFYLVMLHLTNIPDVNKRFGRDVGNLMIAEYIKNMRYHFAREKQTLFRITGIQFAFIIKDDLKYQNLHRALTSGGDLINLKLSIGGIQQIIYPNLGIIKHDPWSKIDINDLISLSNKALEEAISDHKNNYSIFGGS